MALYFLLAVYWWTLDLELSCTPMQCGYFTALPVATINKVNVDKLQYLPCYLFPPIHQRHAVCIIPAASLNNASLRSYVVKQHLCRRLFTQLCMSIRP